jgi:DNA repair exonuclease SbcCD ATPase subunit
MQSYEVQERVMNLKSRLLMLSAAQSLWKRIGTGYASIEEKTQQINALRLEIEHDLKAEQELTIMVANLKRQVADKEYSLNMSKSQSLISLRADLKEGTACSVCGATHHPYHSDTMQDQYKLISDFRSDFETMSGELQGKERQLAVLHDKLTQNLGRQIAEQHNLETVRLRQSEDVKEWRIFAQLDPTFNDCSASTDNDSRMATIRQLIDNAQRDLQNAEAELGEFNYHTTQITNLSGKISQLENRKNEITLRMNEATSLCRILVAQGDKLEESAKIIQEKFYRHYELAQKEITIQEWFKLWQQNAELLYRDIRQMASEWQETDKNIALTNGTLSKAQIKLEMLSNILKQCQQDIDDINEELRRQKGKYSELRERRHLLLPTMSTGEALDKSLTAYYRAQQEHAGSMANLQTLALQQKEQEGAFTHARQTGEVLDQKASEQRNLVDLWIRAYNANHPPVQYNELNAVLTQNIDWNEKRRRIRENRLATSLQQQKVKTIQSEIIALEVDTGTLSNSQLNEKQIATEAQIEQQEQALREVTMQIARLKIELGL